MKPNIFNIGTKELHQDAFITWLLQYADKKYEQVDPIVNQCGKEFISSLIIKGDQTFNEEITSVEAGRQWDHIDVWAKVNNKYLIIIEDKTISSFHSGQLERYQKKAFSWCVENNFNPPICIYLKTGNDSKQNLKKVRNKGYFVFQRINFLDILNKYAASDNDIFTDFRERLVKLEHVNNQYMEKNIGEWNGNDWQGFFQFLDREIHLVTWNFVNNPSGGFWNALVNWKQWGIYPVYVQLEEGKLCFKVSKHPHDLENPCARKRGAVRNEVYGMITRHAEIEGFSEIEKPKRFGNGNYMTVAVVKRHIWLGKKDEKLNPEQVIENVRKYTEFLDRAIAQNHPIEQEKIESTL